VDPGSHGRYAGEVTVSFDASGITGRSAQNVAMTEYQPSRIFQDQFSKDRRKVTTYLDDTITWLSGEMSGAESLFGPSPLMSLIHSVQLDLSGADLSFASPLSLDARLEEGPVLVSDMFKLYRFENMLYVMELTGSEIDGFLEHAASIWFNTMTGPGDHLLQYENGKPGRLANPYYNFSSAAGIRYTIDVTEDPGERVRIHGFSDGTSFDPTGKYRVAINSYRGNGGGGHLISGAGIPKEELSDRITWSTDIDLRYYLMQYLTRYDTLTAEPVSNWYCIPESWVKRASEAERAFFY
jgi:2',3'-cyclic-nucleotide 2'-phosphodiesterase/3'-nucleotidase